MMSTESYLLLQSFFLGIAMALTYDILRAFRRVLPHNRFFAGMEDMFYWIAVTVAGFLMLQRADRGRIRWFAAAGVCIGLALFEHFVGAPILKKIPFRRKTVDGHDQTV